MNIHDDSGFQVSTWAIRWRTRSNLDLGVAIATRVLSLLLSSLLDLLRVDEVGVGGIEWIEKEVDDGVHDSDLICLQTGLKKTHAQQVLGAGGWLVLVWTK